MLTKFKSCFAYRQLKLLYNEALNIFSDGIWRDYEILHHSLLVLREWSLINETEK